MIPSDPLSIIETLPYELDCRPNGRVLLAGFTETGERCAGADFGLVSDRPLDDAIIAITRWPAEATHAVAVAYTDRDGLDLQPLVRAASASGRTVVQVLRAGERRWRDIDCRIPRCCPRLGNRYGQPAPGHSSYQPIPERSANPQRWRTARWDAWQRLLETGGSVASGQDLAALARSLFDIPLRDALLAQSAQNDGAMRPAMQLLFARLLERSSLGTAIPAFTCAAALAYLDGDLLNARDVVNSVLALDEYSLARLLRNGLDMRAPASLLARSFSHFDPIDLLAA